MQSSSTFIRISGPIPEVKKSTLIYDYEYYRILGKVRTKRGIDEQVWFVPNTLEGLRVGATPEKLGYFHSHLSLEGVFPAVKATEI